MGIGFDSDKGKKGEDCCMAVVKLRVTAWITKRNDKISDVTISGRPTFSAECIAYPCEGEPPPGHDHHGLDMDCEELIDHDNDEGTTPDITGDGSSKDPLKMTFERRKYLGCCNKHTCVDVLTHPYSMVIEEEIDGIPPPSDDTKEYIRSLAHSHFWFGGYGDMYNKGPVSWEDGPQTCCAEEADSGTF